MIGEHETFLARGMTREPMCGGEVTGGKDLKETG